MKNTQDKKPKKSLEKQANTRSLPARDKLGRLLPGNTANPNGKPKGISITALVKAELEKAPEGQELTYAQLFLKKLFKKAIVDGDHATQKLIWNYIDGLPKGSLGIGFDDETKDLLNNDQVKRIAGRILNGSSES